MDVDTTAQEVGLVEALFTRLELDLEVTEGGIKIFRFLGGGELGGETCSAHSTTLLLTFVFVAGVSSLRLWKNNENSLRMKREERAEVNMISLRLITTPTVLVDVVP